MDTIRLQILNEVILIISKETGISVEDIKSSSRKTAICDARQMFLSYMGTQKDVNYTLAEISGFVNKSHCLIYTSITQMQDKIDTEQRMEETYTNIVNKINDSEVINGLIESYKKKTNREMNPEELAASISLFKSKMEILDSWLAKYYDHPLRSTIIRDKRELQKNIDALELKLSNQ